MTNKSQEEIEMETEQDIRGYEAAEKDIIESLQKRANSIARQQAISQLSNFGVTGISQRWLRELLLRYNVPITNSMMVKICQIFEDLPSVVVGVRQPSTGFSKHHITEDIYAI